MTDRSRMRLGRRPHDPGRLASVPRHVLSASAPAPLVLPRTSLVWTPTLVQNNTLPTCTIAGLMNAARVWALVNGYDLTQTELFLLALYARLAGCADTVAAIGATDGLVMQDVLDFVQARGFDCGDQTPLVPVARAIDQTSAVALRDAVSTTGAAYLGITLYEADIAPGATWTGGTANAGAAAGGHCVVAWNYGQDTFGLATWGETVEADDEWLLPRLEEAYALSWPQLQAT